MATFLLRVELPDRPGALGAVASRIGAVRGDLVAVEVVEHREGKAVDEFVVDLADGDHLSLLLSEIAEVDGVALQDVRPVSGRRHDRRLEAYTTALIILKERTPHRVLGALVARVCAELDATWSAVLDVEGLSVIASHGRPPAMQWLVASLHQAGSAGNISGGTGTGTDTDIGIGSGAGAGATTSSGGAGDADTTSDTSSRASSGGVRPVGPAGGDVGFVDLVAWDLVLAAGRPGWRFGTRERAHLAALAQLADARWAEMNDRDPGIPNPGPPLLKRR